MLYNLAKILVRIAMLFCFRIKIEGKENVPREGAAILAVNHRSYFDPVMSAIACPRSLKFMAKAELFENPIFGGLIKRLGAFPVHRGKGDVGAVKSAFAILKSGGVMLIFPQGKRIKDGSKGKAHSGMAVIAQKMQCPIIPTWISGEYKWMHKITITFGKPISMEEYYGQKLNGQETQLIADNILDTMYSLKKDA